MSTLRESVEPWVRAWWAGDGGALGSALSLFSLPLEGLYRSGMSLRRLAYRSRIFRSQRASIPVVSVGNLVVGGSGKTPVMAWIVGRLQGIGARPAVLLRGYGEDEVQLHRRWNPSAPVIADPDRARAAARVASAGATVAVLDDGFQHRRLARDLDLVLVAAEQPFPGRLLPRGPYREDASALARAHLVVVTRRTADDGQVEETLRRIARSAPGRPTAVLRLTPRGWTDLHDESASAPLGSLLAVSAVAEPHLFAEMATRGSDADVELLAFPDHHAFDAEDARRIARVAGDRTVVVTEKDAVKLIPLEPLLPPVRVLALSVRPERGEAEIEEALRRTVRTREKP